MRILTLILFKAAYIPMFSSECIAIQPKAFIDKTKFALFTGVPINEILPTLAPTQTPANIVDSDRLQLRVRLRLGGPVTRTPADIPGQWVAAVAGLASRCYLQAG